jgi:membrane protein YqaA with SNARE-associated domain
MAGLDQSSHRLRGLALLLIGLALLPGAAWAEAAAAPAPSTVFGSPVVAWLLQQTSLVAAGAVGAVLGFVGKWVFEQWSARLKAQRDFAGKVADGVVQHANKYYWLLATASGVLARGLDEAVRSRMIHLVLRWDSRDDLSLRLDELAAQAERDTFPHLVWLISRFQEFQFVGSNTYLLTDHAAGETCKRLYNDFVDSLSQELRSRLANLHAREIDLGPPTGRRRASEIAPAELRPDVVAAAFGEESRMWRRWLRESPEAVLRAANSLRAYSEVLTHELAHLHRHWFRRGSAGGDLLLPEVAFDDWPHVLTDRSFGALRRTRWSSPLYRPLGGGVFGGAQMPSPDGPDGANIPGRRSQSGSPVGDQVAPPTAPTRS